MKGPTHLHARIDGLLAAAVRGDATVWPADWQGVDMPAEVIERAFYHGVSGLLIGVEAMLANWPSQVLEQIRRQATAQAMWELRHRLVLSELLAGFAQAGIPAVVLKGTALAYDLYTNPAMRARGDTDLLIGQDRLDAARAVLSRQRYILDEAVERRDYAHARQELWRFIDADGMGHDIDLHWHAFNTPALDGVVTLAECLDSPLALPGLCDTAMTMDRCLMLLHTAMHRAIHITSPYYLGNIAHYGGDRLIWARDFDLLARSFTEEDWRRLCDLACSKGLAAVCLDALDQARARFGTEIPRHVIEALAAAPQATAASSYLLQSDHAARAWQDLRAVRGLRARFSYLCARLFPSPGFMRTKYPGMGGRPLILLHLRRYAELLRRRPGRSER